MQRPRCVRIKVDETGVPSCIHGPMKKNGGWVCRVMKKSKDFRYNNGKSGQLTKQRWEDKVIRTDFGIYPVPPEKKTELQMQLAEFRYKQRNEYREVNQVWLDQLDNLGK